MLFVCWLAKNTVAGLPRAVIKGLIKLVEDPQGTVEATLAKIKELPAYVKHAPAAFKEHIHAIQAIEDPYEQSKAVGEFMGKVLLAGGAVGKISSKLGRWGKVRNARGQSPKGMITSTIKQFKTPKGWTQRSANNKKGTRYVNTKRPEDYIRFSEVNLHPNAPSGQRMPYFQRHKNGKVLTKTGEWIRKDLANPECYHIPQTMFEELQHLMDL